MLSTRNLLLENIPNEWIFEYYLNLSEKLTGQDIKIKSIFNSKDKIPSMCIYHDLSYNEYRFKDFSSGNKGSAVQLVMDLYGLTVFSAKNKILNDFDTYQKNKGSVNKVESVFYDRFKVTDYQVRSWNNLDQKFWSDFHITSSLLSYYNVQPLEYFTMSKEEPDGSTTSFRNDKKYVYGYFKDDGTLYKIYLPKTPTKKFIKIHNYMQGLEQLRGEKYLLITSSLKDLMAFTRLGIKNIESIAPDSENTILSESLITKIKNKYQKVIVLFDNDEPGLHSMKRYKELYDLDYIILPLEKDLSDSVKVHGVDYVKEYLFPLLLNTIKNG
jgi:hypothetical protein